MTRSNTGLFGGLFGGLLAGTMLGSLFGGHGMAGGMAGGFMNLLLIGLLVYFGLRFFRRMQNGERNDRSTYQQRNNTDTQTYAAQGSAWDTLRSAPQSSGTSPTASSIDVPADFDQEDFLRGAKAAYTRMQASWDSRDLDDIAQFATEDVMQELRQQAQADPMPGKTELLLVNASVLEVRDEGSVRRVAVYFDVLMREDQRASRPEQVREVWHFVCPKEGNESWKLDGIQQLA
jgi:predicted lipid-binding transport protein (Tim44 family)